MDNSFAKFQSFVDFDIDLKIRLFKNMNYRKNMMEKKDLEDKKDVIEGNQKKILYFFKEL